MATDTNMEGIKIVSSGDTYNDIQISANRSGTGNHIGRILGQWGSGNVASIIFNTGGDASGKDDGEIQFATSNGGSSPTTRMTIKQDGKIGINNTNPATDLHIVTTGSSSQDGTFKIGGSDSSLGFVLEYDQASNTVSKITANPTYTNGNALLKISVDGNDNPDQLVLKGNGNIGINETSPGTYLHVKGTGEMLRLETTASGGGQCYIDFDDETATRASIGLRGSSSDTLSIAAINGQLRFDVSGQNEALVMSTSGVARFVNSTGDFKVASNTGNDGGRIILQENTLDAWSIDAQRANGYFRIKDSYNDEERFRITATGKIGMGVDNTSPNGALDIRTTDDDDAIRLVNTSTGNNGIQWWNEYGGLTKRVSMDYGEGDANFDIKCFRGDAQDDRPYGNVRIFTGDYTSPNMNFRVTTLGTVHQPNQPAFLVRDSVSSNAFGSNSYADFDTVILNRGNHYSTSNGRFTAPIAGTYLFISLMLSNGSNRLFHEIRKNGSQVVGTRTESGTGAGQYQSNTTQAILELAKGDWVAIHVGSGGAYGGSYSNFSGYLLG